MFSLSARSSRPSVASVRRGASTVARRRPYSHGQPVPSPAWASMALGAAVGAWGMYFYRKPVEGLPESSSVQATGQTGLRIHLPFDFVLVEDKPRWSWPPLVLDQIHPDILIGMTRDLRKRTVFEKHGAAGEGVENHCVDKRWLHLRDGVRVNLETHIVDDANGLRRCDDTQSVFYPDNNITHTLRTHTSGAPGSKIRGSHQACEIQTGGVEQCQPRVFWEATWNPARGSIAVQPVDTPPDELGEIPNQTSP